MSNNKEDSLHKRYFYKLSVQLFSLALSFVTAGIIPRTLGPALYGVYNYLVDFYDNLVKFFTLGGSEAFYNKLSHRHNDLGLVIFYLIFSVLVACFLISTIFFLIFTSLDKIVLPDQPTTYVLLALILGVFYIFNNASTMDAYGLTVIGERVQFFTRTINTIIIISLFFLNNLNLINLFLLLSFIYFINIIICWYFIYKKVLIPFKLKGELYFGKIKEYIKEFYFYCYPLFLLKIFSFFSSIFERWFLQIIAGNVQQGFYSLSFRISQIFFLFTSSLTPLLMREFSIAYHNNDLKKMALLFRRYIPFFYSITAYFACFVCIQADKVVYIFGGKDFKGAIVAVMIMALYPIHQTYGQLSSSVFMATGKTKLVSLIGVFNTLFGFFITYLLIAPTNLFGLNLGANGLALKVILVQFITVNIQLYFNAKFLKLSFIKYLLHQFICVTVLLGISFSVSLLINHFISQIIVNFIISGIIYTFIIFILILVVPIVMGIKREDLILLISLVKKRLRLV